jgi:hypothetical protein
MNLPEVYNYSGGSMNTYLVEARHQLIPHCIHCGKFVPVLLDGTQYFQRFMQGAPISVFSHLTLSQRELIISGVHPECWDALMSTEGEG